MLGVHIDSTLSWSTHIEHIIKKATTRLYFLKQLKTAGLSNRHLLCFYISLTILHTTSSGDVCSSDAYNAQDDV